MKVLITGGTGYIGGAVADALIAGGHEVVAVARDAGAELELRTRGAVPARGDLRDHARLAALASEVDAVIHAANTNTVDAAEVDTAATRAFLRALAGSGNPFIYTSGAWVLGATGSGTADEHSPRDPIPLVAWRGPLEEEVLKAPGMRGIVLRPGVVFGENGGIPGMLARGELPIVGDGSQRIPLVHVRDLADLYVRALAAPAGSVLHGIALTATAREIVAALAPAFVPASVELEDAQRSMGAFADALALDQVISSERTRSFVGWVPSRRLAATVMVG
jgi:nucleoside-diphosphate-sugar epimerase